MSVREHVRACVSVCVYACACVWVWVCVRGVGCVRGPRWVWIVVVVSRETKVKSRSKFNFCLKKTLGFQTENPMTQVQVMDGAEN